MKATGVVRRIDDLGRVVIPKEIRRTLRIHEGDPLEILYRSRGRCHFKEVFSSRRNDTACDTVCGKSCPGSKCTVCITDHETVVAAAGNGKKRICGEKSQRGISDLSK